MIVAFSCAVIVSPSLVSVRPGHYYRPSHAD